MSFPRIYPHKMEVKQAAMLYLHLISFIISLGMIFFYHTFPKFYVLVLLNSKLHFSWKTQNWVDSAKNSALHDFSGLAVKKKINK